MRIRPHAQNHRAPLNRRDAMLQMGSVVGSGLTLPQLLAAEGTTADQSVPGTRKARQNRVSSCSCGAASLSRTCGI